jgi:FtsH-binding integral membrane protein
MDEIFSKGRLQVAIPVLFGAIYLSAFKNGKQTCDRYFLNYFLYLLMSLTIYFYSSVHIKYEKKGLWLVSMMVLIGGIFAFYLIKNNIVKHLLWVAIIVSSGLLSRNLYKKVDEEDVKNVLRKLIVILVICVIIASLYPQFLTQKLEYILIFALIGTMIAGLIDFVFYEKKYSSVISYIIVFIFSGFVMFDTKRVKEFSKTCVDGNTGYLDNVLDMFINLTGLFDTLLKLEE